MSKKTFLFDETIPITIMAGLDHYQLCNLQDLPSIFASSYDNTSVRSESTEDVGSPSSSSSLLPTSSNSSSSSQSKNLKVRAVGTVSFLDPINVYMVIFDHIVNESVHVDLSTLACVPALQLDTTIEISGELIRYPHFQRPAMDGCTKSYFLQAHIVTVADELDMRLHHEMLKIVRAHLLQET